MDLTYFYMKARYDFGRRPMFSIVDSHFLDTIMPNSSEQKKYCLRNPVHREIQACTSTSEHGINCPALEFMSKGVNHAEGGWPKDVNFNDEEATTRHRRRIEREDDYVNAIMTLTPEIQHLLDQNNAIDMYHHYFKGMEESEPMEKHWIKMNASCKDPLKKQYNRPVACIDWTHEDNPKLAVAHCDKTFSSHKSVNTNLSCFVWDLKKADEPVYEFLPPTSCWQIACSPGSPAIIVGGLEDGRVCIFDSRDSQDPVHVSARHLAHRDPVTALLFLKSRLNHEFFTGSTDGRCLWYDIRNIYRPIDSLIMSVKIPPGETANVANAEPVSVLQYDRAFPTRFYCGTDTGLAINVNRRGKSHQDIMSAIYNAHLGPVKAIHRSPCTSKMFITCGDWTVHIWSEDVKTSPIITGTSQRYRIQDVVWAPYRVSGYMSVGDDGKFCYWDVLRKLRKPIAALLLAKCPLLKIKPHHDGGLIAIGDKEGSIHIITLSESLIHSGERDKQIMLQTYDRETRRELKLETRVKELRLKAKVDQDTVIDPNEMIDEVAQIKATEEEYKRVVLEEIRNSGMPSVPYSGPRRQFK